MVNFLKLFPLNLKIRLENGNYDGFREKKKQRLFEVSTMLSIPKLEKLESYAVFT